MSKIDYLNEDLQISGQNYCLISFVSPEGSQKCDVNGIKVRGVFDTVDEANRKADELRTVDPDFDIYVASVGKWLPWFPDPKKVPSVEYQEPQLNELVKGHRENQIKSKRHFEERKRDLMEQAMEDGSKEGQQLLADKPMHPVAVKQKLEEAVEMITELSKQLDELNEQKKDFENVLSTFTDLDFQEANDEILNNSSVSEVNKALFESENIK
jgi:hypothetical protein